MGNAGDSTLAGKGAPRGESPSIGKLAAAHYRQGNLHMGSRDLQAAVASYDRALAIARDFAPAWNDRARALRWLGRPEEALASCDRAIALQPSEADFHLNRGNVLMMVARPRDALESYQQATALKPDLVEAHFNLAHALRQIGRTAEALESFDRTLALRPAFAEAHHGKGNALADLDRPDEAVPCFDRAIALKSALVESYNNRGMALHRLGHFEAALSSYDRAIALRPGYALAFHNRGTTFHQLGRLGEALRDCSAALDLEPRFAEAFYNRGNVLKALKRPEEALRDYERAIALKPGLAGAYWNRAVCTLLMGRFEEGWPLYEKRRREPELPPPFASEWPSAESFQGKTLYIRAEQGLGDTIQFCRYALLAAEKGADVALAVQDPLVRLMSSLEPAVRIMRKSADPPAADIQIALLSMPLAFRTGADTIPARISYVSAEPERVRRWKERIGRDGFRIGICWQGAPGGEVDIGRSFPVRYFEGIASLPGVRLVSLQKNAGAGQLLDLPAGMDVQSFGNDLDPGADAFVDTAAVMENLDLVITSDTAVAHLAGALGRPVWLALNFVPDWRWLLDRVDSPWYPTMRLFRQTERGNWQRVFAVLEAELRTLLLDARNGP